MTVASGGADKTIVDTISNFENAIGGSGDDIIYGSKAGNALEGNGGADQILGLGGNDTLNGGEGNDTLDGGSGNDDLYGGSDSDSLNGGDGDDYLLGQEGNDTLDGGSSNDVLMGGNESDILDGGSGNDNLVGGDGSDTLTGGLGVDQFFFTAITESGVTDTTRDVITDFTQGTDKIHLREVDADTTTLGRQPFIFIGMAPFGNHAGELHIQSITNGTVIDTLVEADVNGDGIADFSILLKGNIQLAQDDFIL